MSTPRTPTATTSTARATLCAPCDERCCRPALRAVLRHYAIGVWRPREHNMTLTVAGWTEDPPPFIGESPRRDRRAGTTPPPEGAAAVGDPSHPIAA